MVRSLAVILIPIVVLSVLFTRNPEGDPVQAPDWVPVLTVAREQSPYPVLAPAAVPAGWRVNVATWLKDGDPGRNGTPSVGNSWQLGLLTAEDVYVGVYQRDADTDTFVEEQTRRGTPDGQSTVGGRSWQRMLSEDERTRSLVSTTPEVTTVVVSDLPYEGLEAFAQTLRTD